MISPSIMLQSVRAELAKQGNAERAKQMQRYMKSQMPYHGVPSAPTRAIAKAQLGAVVFTSWSEFRTMVRTLWHEATHREERYIALTLLGMKSGQPFVTMEALGLYEELIVSGAWWDFVDDLAVHRVGALWAVDPAALTTALRAWAASDNLWKRRSAIISQLQRASVDLDFLYDAINAATGTKEFFLNKAIGWALRELSKRQPSEVQRFVAHQGERLAPLARREALRLMVPPSQRLPKRKAAR